MAEVAVGDSVVVRWRRQDRQRGPRQETRYRIAAGAVGKVADMVLIEGAPWQHITHLRRTHTVVRAGRDYVVDALYRTVGVMPKRIER